MRLRVVQLAAAAVLLAAGIVVGAGPLQHDGDQRARDLTAVRKDLAAARRHNVELTRTSDLGSAFAAATLARTVAGSLTGRSVALVVLPGADPDQVTRLSAAVATAGGKVTARVEVRPAAVAPTGRGLTEALTTQMVAQTPGLVVAPGASGYGRFGALLARAVGVPPAAKLLQAPYDPTAVSVLAGFETAKLIGTPQVSARAALTLVVTGRRATDFAVTTLSDAVAAYGVQIPTVVVGPAAAARKGGLLERLRSGASRSTVSTVDGTETATGWATAVLALSAKTRGVTGAYGGVGAVSAAVPPL
ncbi:MAG: copper transporter [Marmoricola sp.]